MLEDQIAFLPAANPHGSAINNPLGPSGTGGADLRQGRCSGLKSGKHGGENGNSGYHGCCPFLEANLEAGTGFGKATAIRGAAMRHLRAFILSFLLMPAFSPVLQAQGETQPSVRDAGPFVVDRVTVLEFAGEFEVVVVEGTSTRLTIEGEEETLNAFRIEEAAGELVITAPKIDLAGSTTVITGGVHVQAAPGSEASVVIGGRQVAPGTSLPEPPHARLELPAGTSLQLERFSGTGRIGDLAGPLTVSLQSGRITAGTVGDVRLAIAGGGEIETASVSGQAHLEIGGAGLIRVMDGAIDHLVCIINGAGGIEVGGRARAAEARIAGTGTIGLTHVEERPEISVMGAGRVTVGNHR